MLSARELDVRLSSFPLSPLIFGFQLFLKFLKFLIFDFQLFSDSSHNGFQTFRFWSLRIIYRTVFRFQGIRFSGKTIFRKYDFQLFLSTIRFPRPTVTVYTDSSLPSALHVPIRRTVLPTTPACPTVNDESFSPAYLPDISTAYPNYSLV